MLRPGWQVPAVSDVSPEDYLTMLVGIADLPELVLVVLHETMRENYGNVEVMSN